VKVDVGMAQFTDTQHIGPLVFAIGVLGPCKALRLDNNEQRYHVHLLAPPIAVYFRDALGNRWKRPYFQTPVLDTGAPDPLPKDLVQAGDVVSGC
jgi:hypothetical protein